MGELSVHGVFYYREIRPGFVTSPSLSDFTVDRGSSTLILLPALPLTQTHTHRHRHTHSHKPNGSQTLRHNQISFTHLEVCSDGSEQTKQTVKSALTRTHAHSHKRARTPHLSDKQVERVIEIARMGETRSEGEIGWVGVKWRWRKKNGRGGRWRDKRGGRER